MKVKAERGTLKQLIFAVAKIQGRLNCMAACHPDSEPMLRALERQADKLVKDISAALKLS